MTDILVGDVWCSKDDPASQRVLIVTCRPGRRIRLRRLTGRAAGKEILVHEDQLRAAFRYGWRGENEDAVPDGLGDRRPGT
jgi:hypothetical protein